MFFRLTAALCLVVNLSLFAASTTVRITDPSNQPITEAEVVNLETGQVHTTDDEGKVTIDSSDTSASFLARAEGYQTEEVETRDGEETAEVQLEPLLEAEVTMTVTGESRSVSEVSQTVDVLSGAELEKERQISLGETLSSRPGISATAFGNVASRPIIRGLSGDRIRILEGGLDTGDVSTTSVDHAITVDMAGVDRIEILRGPSTLRYGGSALGGVVNIIDNRIPDLPTDNKVHGDILLGGDTVADSRNGRAAFNGGIGSFAWQANVTSSETDDYDIPGMAERFPEEDEEQADRLENSAMDLQKFGVGLSYTGSRAKIGFSISDYRNDYGVPGHGHHGHEEDHDDEHGDEHDDHDEHDDEHDDHGDEHDDHDEHGDEHGEEESVLLDMDQARYDLEGSLSMNGGWVQELRLNVGGTDYEHIESEGGEGGTRFTNELIEGRLEAVTGSWALFDQGYVGVQYTERDFAAIGDEAFIAPNRTDKTAFYLSQEKGIRNGNVSFGVRYDYQENELTDQDETSGLDQRRTFDNVSAAVGLVLGSDTTYGLAANLTHTERAPTAESLFASGAHLATSTFERGDFDLNQETSRGVDLQLRKQEGRLRGVLSLFLMDFDDYVYERFTGETVEGLEEVVFTQDNSRSWGGELELDFLASDNLLLQLSHDLVRSRLDDGTPLPRITPQRTTLAATWSLSRVELNARARHTQSQERLAPFETDTDSFTMVDLSAVSNFNIGSTRQQLVLSVRNLTDEEARIHASFLKDRILQPGRNVSLTLRSSF